MLSSRSSRVMWAVLAVLGLLVSACGSRVASSEQAARVAAGDETGATGDDELSGSGIADDVASGDPATGSAATGSASSGGGKSSTASGSAATGGGTSGGASGGGAAGGGSSGGGSGALTASSPGVTATEIKLGLVYDKSAGATNAAFGFAGVGQIDQKRAYDALIADVNKRGGIGGRKLVPVYHEIDTAGPDSATPPEVLEQRICTTFTENRVFVTFYGGRETFTRCMNKLGVVRIGGAGVDSQLLAESPLLVVLNITLDRAGRFTTGRLADRGYYDKGKNAELDLKIGLLRYDNPSHERAAKAIKAELAARGLKLTDEIAVKRGETVDQIQDETNALRAAALKMKSDGITHVQFVSEYAAFMELIFMQNAEKQLYHPRYGLNSTSGGQSLAVLLGADAQAQLAASLQVGWFPIFDVQAAEYSGDKTTVAFRKCIKVLEESGEKFTEGDPTRNKEAIAAGACDRFNYLEAAAGAAGANLTPDTFMQKGVAGIEGLDSATTFILSTNQRRDAYGGAKDGQFFDDCSCFKYISPTINRM